MLTELLTRIRFLLRRRTHREVDEELAFHLEQQVEANVAAGMTPKEARRQAVIAFGGVEQAREECREARPGYRLEMVGQDVRYALRGFRRNPVFTVTIVVTLMLGIGATTAVFSVVDRILFRALPYAHADRLVSVGLVQSLETEEFVLGGFYYDWKKNQKPFEEMTSENATAHECDLTERNPTQLTCSRVEGNFLPTLGVSPVLGRNFLPEEDLPGGPNVALISYGLWLTHYNRDPGILNKTIDLDGTPVRVVGVLSKDFEMPRLQTADVLLPMAVTEAMDRKSNSGLGGPKRVYARLKPGVSVEQARAEMEPLFEQLQNWIPAKFRSEFRKDFHLRVRSLRDRQMQDVRKQAWVLLCAALAVLLIACANVASLLMARGAVRQRELAVRSALGASRARLAGQALTESLLLSLAGAIAGCALAEGLLRAFVAIAPETIPYLDRVQLDLRIVCFTIILSIICGVLFGLGPALQRPNEELMIGRSSLTTLPHATLRQWLVVAQIAASMVLLTGATLLLHSFRNLENQQLGMRDDNTVTAKITLGYHNYSSAASKMAFFQQLAMRLRFGPGVSAVSVSDSLPPAAGHIAARYGEILVAGRAHVDGGESVVVRSRMVSPDYFRALDIPILRGEGFQDGELSSSERSVVISQDLAGRLFPEEDPIGKRLNFDRSEAQSPWFTVVGVAANVRNGGLSGEEDPEYYMLRRNRVEDWGAYGLWDQTSVIVVRSSLPPQVLSRWIRSQVADLDPTVPVDLETMQQRVSKLADGPRFQTLLVGFFALTGLVLAVIGLYGVISFLVVQRRQEIGVRMALGASRGDILRMVMGKSLRLIVWGTGIGLVAALAGSRVLASLLFGVVPRDVVSFALVTLLLILAGVAATLIPARAAAKVDPMVALRWE